MGFRFGKASEHELESVHPDLVAVVREALGISPVDFAVTDGLRTSAEQRALIASGASWTMNSRHLEGPDGFAHAVDLTPYINGKPRWEWQPIYRIAECMRQVSSTSGTPIVWGGVWDRRMTALGVGPLKLEAEVKAYGARRRAIKAAVRIDGPHYQLPKTAAYP